MNQITVAPEFFKNERNNYKCWRNAFWRELFQNSIDARATKINVVIQHCYTDRTFLKSGCLSESTIVTFDDDGTGFNADARDNVFFCLGKTNKGNIGDVGGFGKARVVICFSQNNYQIISQDWRVTGEGGSYEIHDFNGYYKGCSVIVDVDSPYNDLINALHQYLSASQLNCRVTINNEAWSTWCYRRRLTERLSFGDVYVNKSGGTHRGHLVVRVNGIPMFTRYIGINSQVVVEIDADKSREVLLSNRDMFHSKYQIELDEFVRRISIDTESGLRRSSKKWIVFPGNAKVTRRKKKYKKFQLPDDISEWAKITATQITATQKTAFVKACKDIPSYEPISKDFVNVNYSIVETLAADVIDELIPSAVVLLETDNSKVRKVFPRYDMRFWNGSDDGGNRKKLLRQWTIICNFVVEELLEYRDQESLYWRPGFVFSDYAAAKHTKTDNTDIFMLNPVDEDGKITFGLRNKKSWTKMIILACHEVTHNTEEYHNETFMTLSETLIERVLCRREEVFRALKDSLKKTKVLN